MENRFDKLYKLIMQGKMTYKGRSNYSQDTTKTIPVYCADGTQLCGLNSDGTPCVNPNTGLTENWGMLCSDYPDQKNYLTGQKLPMYTTTLALRCHDGNPFRIQIPVDTYLEAYKTKNEELIATLQALGLKEGLVINF